MQTAPGRESPLVQAEWWRVALDEAQMVEAVTSNTAEMALLIPARHRWAITGTPIGARGFDDLFGLLVYLQCDPYDEPDWWARVRASQRDHG
jgi:hypothetical protein